MLRWLVVAAIMAVSALGLSRLAPRLASAPAAEARAVADRSYKEPWDGALDVPHIRQEPELCVPTAAAMVLAFYGDPQPPRRLKALAGGRTYVDASFNDFTMTLYRDLVRGLKTLGYDWREETFPVT